LSDLEFVGVMFGFGGGFRFGGGRIQAVMDKCRLSELEFKRGFH